MNIKVSSIFKCALEDVVRELKKPQLLLYVAGAFMRFVPEDPVRFPETWLPGEYKVKMHLFRFIPFGFQYVVIQDETFDGREYRIRDNGRGGFVCVWDHRITARAVDGGGVLYSDEVLIRPGALTPMVFLFAALFYRYRQYRWKKLIRAGFDYKGA